jgi:plasmid stabilization system protein ParE
MAFHVEWTEAAWSDLEEVADYIARDSRYYAAAFVEEVRDAARSLSSMAWRGRVVPEFGNPGIRELLVGRYRLVYRLRDETVHIIGLVHCARDLDELCRPDRS